MTTSGPNTITSEIESGEVISAATRAYFQSRLRNRLYTLVISNFRMAEGKGMTRAKLARRMGKRPEIVTRLLSAPGNWTLDTVSDLLLAASGEELDATSSSPFTSPPRNYDAYLRMLESSQGCNDPPKKPDIKMLLPRAGSTQDATPLFSIASIQGGIGNQNANC